MTRAALAGALSLLPLFTTVPAHAAPTTLPLEQAIASLPVAVESRDGYSRTAFKHWNSGANAADGCSTRNEVLLAEAVIRPVVLAGCKLEGGQWHSYYDNRDITSASGLDIDHMVPLAEAWDSGASQWTAKRREAYANDLGADASLVAVSAASNRSKADQDPTQWLPPHAAGATCQYITEWTATKKRWSLTADTTEQKVLTQLAAACPDATVTYEPAP
ncbi:HNH endonuclease family protein [Streptomyces roseolilacinus]|uniref:HNH endonuclease family protein n=1 Tax=Streptomyces roseolilacinus TaxID=66904 RepID=UPI0038170356